MALSHKEKERLAAKKHELPEDREVRQMLIHFLGWTGLTDQEFGEMIGYSRQAVSNFRSGAYLNNHFTADGSLAIRDAIKSGIEHHQRYRQEMDQGEFYKIGCYAEIRRAFFNALDNAWAYCIDGPPGTRKSFVCKHLRDELARVDADKNGHGRRCIYVYCRQGIRPRDLLIRICQAAGIPSQGTIDQLIKKLNFFLGSRRCVLVLDEGQHLDEDCVEVLRELLDMPPYFGMLFVGSHDIQEVFNKLRMEQWRSRIQNTVVLNGLSRDDAEFMIRASFPKVTQKALEVLIAGATVPDFRFKDGNKQPITYLSARQLMFAINNSKTTAKGAHA